MTKDYRAKGINTYICYILHTSIHPYVCMYVSIYIKQTNKIVIKRQNKCF